MCINSYVPYCTKLLSEQIHFWNSINLSWLEKLLLPPLLKLWRRRILFIFLFKLLYLIMWSVLCCIYFTTFVCSWK
jgi:hypothetical protein